LDYLAHSEVFKTSLRRTTLKICQTDLQQWNVIVALNLLIIRNNYTLLHVVTLKSIKF